ncbi:aldehyde dehydrogenase family protein [Bradyrhizobium cenepequi]|uniref:aldehyde dehydrogenase family protein n=1 Tax=Bradyrhizobium cenepequi TaxID=2821403 RepID=UPI001CE37F4C|nr:aldehyde dehydrogenase family protein [Bradyrhizobium cenepequi]MCA6111193.1 aldehyde dehydrogenase family protein [Bradyrhizobium cenepequi]
MRQITQNYVDGAFQPVSDGEEAPLFNPATEEQIGTVRLSNVNDVNAAVAAAKRAFTRISGTPPAERAEMLRRLSVAVSVNGDRMAETMREEYGAPSSFVDFSARRAGSVFLDMAATLESFAWQRRIGSAEVEMRPIGVAAAITPWNSNYGFICGKLATAIAAGTSIVIKPSEMSALQTQVLTEALHKAGLPAGVLNIVNGSGAVAGAALTAHPDIAKISFTGSTVTGRAILQSAAETMKRVTLELGGKGAQIILDDADLEAAVAQVLASGFINSGQACIAGTRVLVPARLMPEVRDRLVAGLADWPVGPASDPASRIGPMVSRKQWERVQSYIRLGTQEGATIIAGGEVRPAGLDRGWFVRPTLFADVDNATRIAREEIFGPVLCVISYDNDEDAVRIANDADYGLQNFVLGGDPERTWRVAARLESGRVTINGAAHEPLAPFGGCKQSGIGREFGVFGLETFLEPQVVLT